jgi:hypothetical protein
MPAVCSVERHQLKTAGTHIDTISEVSAELSSMDEVSQLVKLLAMVFKLRYPSPSNQCHLGSLVKTLTADCLESVSAAEHRDGFTDEEAVQYFQRFLSPVLDGLAGLGELEEAVGASIDPLGFRQFWALDGRNMLSESVTGELLRPIGLDPETTFINTFIQGNGRRLALTRDRGALALVPGSAKPGDELWILANGNLPFVLRREDHEHEELRFTLVGETYVHGLSRGEAFEPPDGDLGESVNIKDMMVSVTLI